MTTQQIAQRLVELCRASDYETAQKELYAADAVSIEPYASPQFDKETKGLDAILAKGEKFKSMTEEIYSTDVSEPLVVANSFCTHLTLDSKMKEKERMKMSELCVYEVKDGKIVSERFYV